MGMKIKRSKGCVLAVPTSSMGDIAFLLIIFFMLTSKFMQESHVKCEIPASPDAQKIEDQPVSVILDENGDLWLQGQTITTEALKVMIEGLRGDNKNFTVMLKIHKSLNSKKYNTVIRKIAEAGAKVAFVGEKGMPSFAE